MLSGPTRELYLAAHLMGSPDFTKLDPSFWGVSSRIRGAKYVYDKKFNFLYLDTGNTFNKTYHKNFTQLDLYTKMDEMTDLLPGK